MLTDWQYWITGLHTNELLQVLLFLLLVDMQRYGLSVLIMALRDVGRSLFTGRLPGPAGASPDYNPSVTVLIVGYNEADTIRATMQTVRENRPDVQLIVVDDGSTDDMESEARRYAEGRQRIIVLRREERGGKSAALNYGLAWTTGELLVTVDADSHLEPGAIDELIQPMSDPAVDAVSATVVTANAFTSLITWLQAYEYRQTIFLGRLLKGRTGILAIVSGAFGVFRTQRVRELGGWDVGPGEDGDLILRMRKTGGRIAIAPFAHCHTNAPLSWRTLFRQRCRWDRTVITFECRKHANLATSSRGGQWLSNLALMAERWFLNVSCVYTFWLYGIWVFLIYPDSAINLLILLYLCGMVVELIQLVALLLYSDRLWYDLKLGLVIPFYPLYQVFLKVVGLVAVSGEILFRDSTRDNFVPARVREATWHW